MPWQSTVYIYSQEKNKGLLKRQNSTKNLPKANDLPHKCIPMCNTLQNSRKKKILPNLKPIKNYLQKYINKIGPVTVSRAGLGPPRKKKKKFWILKKKLFFLIFEKKYFFLDFWKKKNFLDFGIFYFLFIIYLFFFLKKKF